MAKELTFGQISENMKDSGRTMRCTDRGRELGLMGDTMKGDLRKI